MAAPISSHGVRKQFELCRRTALVRVLRPGRSVSRLSVQDSIASVFTGGGGGAVVPIVYQQRGRSAGPRGSGWQSEHKPKQPRQSQGVVGSPQEECCAQPQAPSHALLQLQLALTSHSSGPCPAAAGHPRLHTRPLYHHRHGARGGTAGKGHPVPRGRSPATRCLQMESHKHFM